MPVNNAANNIAQQRQGQQSGAATTAQNQADQTFGPVAGYDTGLLTSQGYTPEEQAAITRATMGGLGAATGSAQREIGEHAGSSGNGAAYGADMDSLARSSGINAADAAAQNATAFAKDRQSQQNLGAAGLAQLYGMSASDVARLLGGSNAQAQNLSNPALSVIPAAAGALVGI